MRCPGRSRVAKRCHCPPRSTAEPARQGYHLPFAETSRGRSYKWGGAQAPDPAAGATRPLALSLEEALRYIDLKSQCP